MTAPMTENGRRVPKGQCESLWWSARINPKTGSHWNECTASVPYGTEVLVDGHERLCCPTHRAEVARAVAAGMAKQLRWRTPVHA